MKGDHFTFEKHILICGKSETDRHNVLNRITEQSNLQFFRFPKTISTLSDYLNVVQAKKLFSPFYETRGKYNANQIFDFHIDWIAENNCLFIFEEFEHIHDKFGLEIMRIMINNLEANRNSGSKILITLENEVGLINNLSEIVDETKYKTKDQLVESNLQLIVL